MKIINNSAVEFFSTFCPSFYEKNTQKNTRDDCLRMSILSEDKIRPGVQVNSARQELS